MSQHGVSPNTNPIVARNLSSSLIADKGADFASVLAASPDTLSLERAPAPQPAKPKAQRQPTTTTATNVPPARTAPVKTVRQAPEQSARPVSGTRINVTVGEDGVKSVTPPIGTKREIAKNTNANERPATQESIDDVTKMIREKLKTLRSI